MSEFADICVKNMMVYDCPLSTSDQRRVLKYFMTVKEWAIFRIKEMPFF